MFRPVLDLGKREALMLGSLALYLVVALIVLTPIRGALGVEGQPAAPSPSVVAGAEPAAEPPTPGLEASQQARARSLVETNPMLAAALRGAAFSIVETGPWTTSGDNGQAARLLGAAYVVAANEPINLRQVRLPGALYDQSEQADPPYQAVVRRVSADGVTQFLVLVDLERGRVVSISPGPGAQQLKSVPERGFKRKVPRPQDGGL